MNYYYLIAGLPDIKIEDNKLTFTIADFRKEVRPQLSKADARLFDIFYTKFDNRNLLQYLRNKETAEFDERGSITKDELEECFRPVMISEDVYLPNDKFPLPYFKTFVPEYNNAQQADTDVADIANWENRLAGLYYQWAMKCGNKLIADWFEFNLNVNNIMAAYTSRKYRMDVEAVGNNPVAEAIRTSKLRDFGLTEIIGDFDILQRIAEETDLFEREKKLDLLKWQWLDEHTFFNYFNIELLFAYLIKLEIIERWINLDPTEGEKLFRSLISSLKDNVVNSPASINLQKNEL